MTVYCHGRQKSMGCVSRARCVKMITRNHHLRYAMRFTAVSILLIVMYRYVYAWCHIQISHRLSPPTAINFYFHPRVVYVLLTQETMEVVRVDPMPSCDLQGTIHIQPRGIKPAHCWETLQKSQSYTKTTQGLSKRKSSFIHFKFYCTINILMLITQFCGISCE